MGKKGRRYYSRVKNYGVIVIILLYVSFAIISIYGMYHALLESARSLGHDLAHSYMEDEELNIARFQNQVSLGMMYLEDMNDRGAGKDEKEEWLRDYFGKLEASLPGNDLECYAVLDGRVITERPWEGMEDYDYTQREWYRKAVEAEGGIIFTDAYRGAAKEEWVVSVAAIDPESGDGIILDISRETFEVFHANQVLPADGAYYVCDGKGQLLYSQVNTRNPEEDPAAFAEKLCGMAKNGEITERKNDIVGPAGKKRGVYYYWTENGWFCAVTITHMELLQGMRSILAWHVTVLCLLLITASALGYRNRQLFLEVRKKREIIQSLGNSYYAFYRVDVKRKTYEIIKGSEYINAKLPARGEYTDLLHALAGIMDAESGQEFLRCFSTEKVKELIAQRTEGFGGDFLRLFGEEYCWVNVSLLTDEDLGDDKGVICFRKIHEEKQHQGEFQKLLQDVLAAAEMSENSQRQFFAKMSHEMKTPLNIIIGMADMAQNQKEKAADCLAKIKDSAQQLADLIDDILEDSRLDRKKHGQEFFDLEETVLGCTGKFREQADREHKAFEVDMDVADRRVAGDAHYLVHILNRLLSNALEFTGEGDRIGVKVRQAGEGERLRYHFTVEDTGIGMSQEFLPRLFEPYATAGRFEKQRGGKGLGLAIVKNLVTQMGGVIHVESALGEGSSFRVTLPFTAKPPETGDVQAEDSGAGDSAVEGLEAGEGQQEKEKGLKGCRVLLAEDNELNMEIAVELLTMAGAEVVCAVNGREAVEYFENSGEGYFDAVVLDMQMPVLDGCGAAKAIRGMDRPDASVVPIVALTANTLAEDVARTAHAGMNAHLAKPVMAEKLWDTLYGLIMEARKGEHGYNDGFI